MEREEIKEIKEALSKLVADKEFIGNILLKHDRQIKRNRNNIFALTARDADKKKNECSALENDKNLLRQDLLKTTVERDALKERADKKVARGQSIRTLLIGLSVATISLIFGNLGKIVLFLKHIISFF